MSRGEEAMSPDGQISVNSLAVVDKKSLGRIALAQQIHSLDLEARVHQSTFAFDL
jgi:hypothetical protein